MSSAGRGAESDVSFPQVWVDFDLQYNWCLTQIASVRAGRYHINSPVVVSSAQKVGVGPPCILRWSQVCPIVGHCVPLVRADHEASGRTLCDSSGLENKAKQGRRTDVRFLGGSRREREGFTRISESNRRRMERLYNDRRLDLHIIIRYRLTVNARRIDSIDHGICVQQYTQCTRRHYSPQSSSERPARRGLWTAVCAMNRATMRANGTI